MSDDTDHDREFLLRDQYRDDSNLALRQSIYGFAVPNDDGSTPDLFTTTLDVLDLDGTESIADIGCGNGLLHLGLSVREHTGPVFGIDLSAGMLAAASGWNVAALAVGDAQAIPLPDASVDRACALHMLYHVPDPHQAVAELRRITRPGGRIAVSSNSVEHLAELDDIFVRACEDVSGQTPPRIGSSLPFTTENGRDVVGEAPVLHRIPGRLAITDADAVGGYVASLARVPAALPDVDWPAVAARAHVLAEHHIAEHGSLSVRTRAGVFLEHR